MQKIKKPKFNKVLSLIGGGFVGFINGFLGAGGGILAVLLLDYVLKEKKKNSHATAIFIVLPTSLISSIIYISSGVVEWGTLINVMIGVILGGAIGAILLNKINSKIVGVVFSFIVIIAGIRMIL